MYMQFYHRPKSHISLSKSQITFMTGNSTFWYTFKPLFLSRYNIFELLICVQQKSREQLLRYNLYNHYSFPPLEASSVPCVYYTHICMYVCVHLMYSIVTRGFFRCVLP